ncbi:hypothetical protein MKEN_00054200 [Mycena kentingensis (nom. inval.)]|nr:hypothetical protein MKEN_00054200 [Mycena kentingensis (nom. inval.)]
MAARKLQTEIDRTLKKVSEGVELFEGIYDKMQASTNQAQKEKLELELKTQIKKLQRLRDQIKTWVASNDIKDKSQLVENRKLIETQMERFKATEKEMKTKAFSKEGLIQAAKLDPKEQEKEEATLWLQNQVEELQMQVEQAEAEIESLQGTGKKKNKSGPAAGRLEELESLNERRKWHIGRLEIVLRLLNNGSLATERVVALKDDVQYFVESNTEEDFDEDEGIYDDLNLDEEEEKFGIAGDDDDDERSDNDSEEPPPPARTKKHEEEPAPSKPAESPILKKAAAALQIRKQSVDGKFYVFYSIEYWLTALCSDGQTAAESKFCAATHVDRPQSRPTSDCSSAGATASCEIFCSRCWWHEHLRASSGSSACVCAIATCKSSADAAKRATDSVGFCSPDYTAGADTVVPKLYSPVDDKPYAVLRGVCISAAGRFLLLWTGVAGYVRGRSQFFGWPGRNIVPSTSTQRDAYFSSACWRPITEFICTNCWTQFPRWPTGQRRRNRLLRQCCRNKQQPQFPPGVKVPHGEQAGASSTPIMPIQPGQQRPLSAAPTAPPRTNASAFPGSLSDLVVSFESVKQKAANRMNNLDQVHKMLEGGYASVPQPQDTEKPKYYVPRNPFATAAYYPQTPHPLLSTAAIFSQLDVETLFYVFYFHPGTYQQYLAAKELKRQSWRFHVKYLTWFQRHSEPQAITEEYEQGVYVYFDWEGSWCQRKKSDFRFEYRYLSED